MKIQRQVTVALALLANTALFACLMVPAATASPSLEDRIGDQPVSTRAPAARSSKSPNQEIDSTGYWTEEKMRSAIPADELRTELYQERIPRLTNNFGTERVEENLSNPCLPYTIFGTTNSECSST